MMNAIVVDDEQNLLDHLVNTLMECWPDIKIIGTATDGDQALHLCRSLQPDITFLDIKMPGTNGLEVARQIAGTTHVVFVTAYDEFAVEAFENAAVDYILKPATRKRLEKTMERLTSKPLSNDSHLSSTVLDQLVARLQPGPGDPWLRWLRTGQDDQTQLIPVNDVVYFSADNKYTTAVTPHEQFLIRTSISELSESLDPNQFWRVHRSIIVKVSEIQSAQRDIRGRYVVSLKSLSKKLRTSQRYGHLFKLS